MNKLQQENEELNQINMIYNNYMYTTLYGWV